MVVLVDDFRYFLTQGFFVVGRFQQECHLIRALVRNPCVHGAVVTGHGAIGYIDLGEGFRGKYAGRFYNPYYPIFHIGHTDGLPHYIGRFPEQTAGKFLGDDRYLDAALHIGFCNRLPFYKAERVDAEELGVCKLVCYGEVCSSVHRLYVEFLSSHRQLGRNGFHVLQWVEPFFQGFGREEVAVCTFVFVVHKDALFQIQRPVTVHFRIDGRYLHVIDNGHNHGGGDGKCCPRHVDACEELVLLHQVP